MGRIVGNNVGFFFVLGGFIIALVSTVVVFRGDYETTEKIISIIAMVILFFWSLYRFMGFIADIMLPQAFQGRKIFIGGPWSYDMLSIAESFMRYLAEQGAIIIEDEKDAEFRIIMAQDLIDPVAFSFEVTDPQGQQTNFKAYSMDWPRSAAMIIGTFIRRSDRSQLN